MYFLYNGAWSGGHCVTGVTLPAADWHFAEGCTREGFDTYLTLENPQGVKADAEFTFMTGEGEVIPHAVELPPRSRTTLHVNHIVGPGRDVSVSVHSPVPIVVERPMYFRYSTF